MFTAFFASIALQTAGKTMDLKQVAEQAYIYAYPLVLIEATRSGTPTNLIAHVPRFPGPDNRRIVRPNADTLYSTAWIDLSKEPMLIHVPDSRGRFYLLQFMDAWTDTFADPGKRLTGTAETWIALTGPHWAGTLPPGVRRYDSPTNIVWLLGRTQTNGVSDYNNVHSFQKGIRLMPLSDYPNGGQRLASPLAFGSSSGPTPPEQVKAMSPEAFFTAFAEAMKLNPPHDADAPMIHELALLGIVPGKDFDPSKLTSDQKFAIDEGAKEASGRVDAMIAAAALTKRGWAGYRKNIGRYGTNYLARAGIARFAVGANPPEDAVYLNCSADGEGKALNGANHYVIHFNKGELPPVHAFWSLTAYDQGGYFIKNSLNRCAIGDRDPLKFNSDGSLDIYVQPETPGPDRESNWLPSNNGSFNLTIRLYWPDDSILSGAWQPPVPKKTS